MKSAKVTPGDLPSATKRKLHQAFVALNAAMQMATIVFVL